MCSSQHLNGPHHVLYSEYLHAFCISRSDRIYHVFDFEGRLMDFSVISTNKSDEVEEIYDFFGLNYIGVL